MFKFEHATDRAPLHHMRSLAQAGSERPQWPEAPTTRRGLLAGEIGELAWGTPGNEESSRSRSWSEDNDTNYIVSAINIHPNENDSNRKYDIFM